MNAAQMSKHAGLWCRVMYRTPDGEAATNPKAMPRGYSHKDLAWPHEPLWRFTTGGPGGGWELFLSPPDLISVTPLPKENE